MVRIWCILVLFVMGTGLAAQTLLGTALEVAWASASLTPLIKAQYGALAPTSSLEWGGDEDWTTWAINAAALGLPYRGARLAGGKSPARLDGLDAKGLDAEFSARVKLLRSQAKPPLSWDVAANVFTASGDMADSVFRRVWGADWPARALRIAVEADPSTPLFLAEDDALGLNPRSDALYKLAVSLKDRGAPIAGVALGGRQRVSSRATPLEIGANLQRFASLGLAIHVVDWDFGLDTDQTVPDRPSVLAQAQAYQDTFTWLLAVPAVKLVSVAEPSDKYARPRAGVYASPSLVGATGVPKTIAGVLAQQLKRPRTAVADLSTEAIRQTQVPLDGMAGPGLPLGWTVEDVWHLVPATDASVPGGEFRHRATFYRNVPAGTKPGSDDFGLFWYLMLGPQGLVFQVERSDDQPLASNRGEAVSLEVRGPGFAAAKEIVLGQSVRTDALDADWTGNTLRVLFKVPPEAGWGVKTLFFFRFSGTDNDKGGDVGLTLDPWPTATGAEVPWKAFRIVSP